jgi:hypothetical protein
VADDQCWLIDSSDSVSYGEGLATAGNPQKRLVLKALI